MRCKFTRAMRPSSPATPAAHTTPRRTRARSLQHPRQPLPADDRRATATVNALHTRRRCWHGAVLASTKNSDN